MTNISVRQICTMSGVFEVRGRLCQRSVLASKANRSLAFQAPATALLLLPIGVAAEATSGTKLPVRAEKARSPLLVVSSAEVVVSSGEIGCTSAGGVYQAPVMAL